MRYFYVFIGLKDRAEYLQPLQRMRISLDCLILINLKINKMVHKIETYVLKCDKQQKYLLKCHKLIDHRS